jgi:hypothetical protein
VRLISGKYAAFATPILALNAIRLSSGWKARRDGRRLWLVDQGPASRNGAGAIAEQKADLVFALFDLHQGAWNSHGCAVYEFLSLSHIKHCRNAALLLGLD